MSFAMEADKKPFVSDLCSRSEDFKPKAEFPPKEEHTEWLITDVRSLAEAQPQIKSARYGVGTETLVLKTDQSIKESKQLPIAAIHGSITADMGKEIKREENEEGNEFIKEENDSWLESEVKTVKVELEELCPQERDDREIPETPKRKAKNRRRRCLSRNMQSTHQPSPNNDMFFKCDICDKVIKYLASFREHQRIHTGERPYKCKVCKKNFTRSADLIKHGLVHSDRRPHKCKNCGKTFKLAGDLSKHSAVHSNQFPFKCDSCDKSFKRTACLIKHMRIHTEEKPFPCPICSKRFKWESSVREHQRIHSGEKPFQCPDCRKNFTHFSTFQQHKRTHTGFTGISCDICHKTYNRKSNLLKHQRAMHL
uniref:C2H2-type domain-containing protein n=1 Tax=Leptobrachium leishanense TaxID=445787 RepID=A0A8C5LLQ4_9ANUR